MTGEKDRYTTTEKLWKLDDQLLSTPKHDEMVLWLLDKDHSAQIINPMCAPVHTYSDWNEISVWKSISLQIDGIRYTIDQDFANSLEYRSPPFQYKPEIEGIWNQLYTEYSIIKSYLIDHKTQLILNEIKSEVPITANNGFLVGYTDIELVWSHVAAKTKYLTMRISETLSSPHKTYIEVKPVIKSFGETLRQLNTYKHYLHTEELYLFTTDLRFKDAFESQGIKVLTYPEQ